MLNHRTMFQSLPAIGAFVECVDDIPGDVSCLGSDAVPEMSGLRKGTVYTVRWSGRYNSAAFGEYSGLRLQEIKREKRASDHPRSLIDLPFSAHRFRPLNPSRLNVLRAALESKALQIAV